MQGLVQQVTALRPELVNSDATVGEMAWVWGKDHADLGGSWRHRLWFDGGELAGWGWDLPAVSGEARRDSPSISARPP